MAKVRIRSYNIISHLPGPKRDGKNITTAVGAYRKYITNKIVEKIVCNTNQYISRIRGNFSRERDAKDSNDVEIWALIGLLLLSGIRKACHLSFQEIWGNDGTRFEIFQSVMNRERFFFILRCLRFDDLPTREIRKIIVQLALIREIFEEFVTNCKTMYNPGEYLTVDEKVIPFKGRCSFKQYLPNVPSRVERLVLPISGSKRNITTENWYASYPLEVALLNDHKLTLLNFWFSKKNVSLVSYVSKRGKSVILLSTMHPTATIDEETNEKKKPEMITFYNMTKGGVYLLDQKTSLYSVGRRTKRWPLCIFFELLNIAGINCKLLFDGDQPQNIYKGRKDFLKALSLELVTEYHHIRSTTKSFSKPLRSIVRKHAEDIPEPLSKAQKRCHLCSYKKDRKTKTLCQKCQKNVCKEHSIIINTSVGTTAVEEDAGKDGAGTEGSADGVIWGGTEQFAAAGMESTKGIFWMVSELLAAYVSAAEFVEGVGWEDGDTGPLRVS
ncbi:hypothetical protein LAZ67_12002726 [Cordylochernes scorpioides]|uniref:PiggyBac transposable element-derived protein domain-containing protein n=1 Tax=Cordylochernes scorpioides TaxID=51811 RepID=A0ABY6L2T7_9ARAC|nr:hypothetical protein LAZ67_12002726 [Cordylochernes scorpioides]